MWDKMDFNVVPYQKGDGRMQNTIGEDNIR